MTLSEILELAGCLLLVVGLSWAAGVAIGGVWLLPVALSVAGLGIYALHLLHERARKGKR